MDAKNLLDPRFHKPVGALGEALTMRMMQEYAALSDEEAFQCVPTGRPNSNQSISDYLNMPEPGMQSGRDIRIKCEDLVLISAGVRPTRLQVWSACSRAMPARWDDCEVVVSDLQLLCIRDESDAEIWQLSVRVEELCCDGGDA